MDRRVFLKTMAVIAVGVPPILLRAKPKSEHASSDKSRSWIQFAKRRSVWLREESTEVLQEFALVKCIVSYRPIFETWLIAQKNTDQLIAVRFPDGSILEFYGRLRQFERAGWFSWFRRKAVVTIESTNWDPVVQRQVPPRLVSV